MTKAKDHYIRALEYGESHAKFTLEDLTKAIDLSSVQEEQLALQIHQNQIFNQNASDYINNYKGNSIYLHFSVEDKFRLLNYIALQEARESSKSATCFAGTALVISIASLIISAVLSYMQLKSPINIPAELLDKIDLLFKEKAATNRAIVELSRNILHQREMEEKKSSPAKSLEVAIERNMAK